MSDLDSMLSGVPASKDTYPDEPEFKEEPVQAPEPEPEKEPEPVEEPEAEPEQETESVDEYGNEIAKDTANKTYTQEELNERINQAVRERLARLERNQGVQQPEQPQAPQTEEDWQKELEKMIDARIEGRTQQQQQQEQQQREMQAQQEFEQKFHNGMSKFKDFQDVVGSKPITDAMVHATRGMKDPASFFYAAAKKAPDDLDRIAKIGDPYAQIAEMGRLDAKLRTQKAATKAPRPLSRTSEDVSKNYSHTSGKNVDDLISESNKKRMDALLGMSGGGRGRRR